MQHSFFLSFFLGFRRPNILCLLQTFRLRSAREKIPSNCSKTLFLTDEWTWEAVYNGAFRVGWRVGALFFAWKGSRGITPQGLMSIFTRKLCLVCIYWSTCHLLTSCWQESLEDAINRRKRKVKEPDTTNKDSNKNLFLERLAILTAFLRWTRLIKTLHSEAVSVNLIKKVTHTNLCCPALTYAPL